LTEVSLKNSNINEFLKHRNKKSLNFGRDYLGLYQDKKNMTTQQLKLGFASKPTSEVHVEERANEGWEKVRGVFNKKASVQNAN